jgi:3-oxoacyl-[acyl-carrier-protein] synthase II
MKRRVVITGLSSLSAAGANLEEHRASFASGRCCLSPITDPRAGHLKARFAGLVQMALPGPEELPEVLGGHDRHVVMAYVAAREALRRGGVDPDTLGARLGLVFATCSGPMLLIEEHYERVIRGDPAITAEQLYAKRYYSGAEVLAEALGITGFRTTVVTACTAGSTAIALAADLIRCGILDAALAGGSDSFSTSTLAGFDGLKATAEGRCAPFSKPPGLNLGEAAAFAVLESLSSAEARSAPIEAEVLGCGLSNDAYHCSSPEPGGRGLALAIQRAFADARVNPATVSYVNAHGTGTEANDKAETRALRKALGDRANETPVSSMKSMVGHCLGAAGAIEIVGTILCAGEAVLPPTANFTEARDGCNLDYVPQPGRPWLGPRTFLSTNLAFGGHNSAVVVRAGALQASTCEPLVEADDEIWITGCGVVCAAGIGRETVLEALKAGKTGVREVSLGAPGRTEAGMVDDAAAQNYDRRLDLRQMDRSSRWATIAARLAMREAAFPQTPGALADLGLFLSLSAGPSWAESEFLTSFLSNARQVNQLMAFPYIVPCSVAGNVCRALRLAGHNLSLSGGKGAGLAGLIPAIAALRNGHAGALLCGAVDELSERILADEWHSGSLKEGRIAGEGSVVLMLETASHARARNVLPAATIRALNFVTCPRKMPRTAVVQDLLETTLRQAGISRKEVRAFFASELAPGLASPVINSEIDWPSPFRGLGRQTGLLEASQPLLDLVCAMGDVTPTESRRPFVACVAPSGRNGYVAALISLAQ